MAELLRALNIAKPFLLVIFLQFGNAGMSIVAKYVLNQGMSDMSPNVFAVYRHAIATIFIAPFAILIDRKVRPKITISIFIKILLLGWLSVGQNYLLFVSMKYTTATFASAMCSVLPAYAFLLAWIFSLENVKIREMRSQAKILGTLVTVGGAMLMTMVKGPFLDLPWEKINHQVQSTGALLVKQDPEPGVLMIATGSLYWAYFYVLQANTLESYPAELSLTALICLMGTLEGGIFALAVEAKNPSAWSIHLDSKLLAAVYSGVICSGVAYYVQGVVMKAEGPVFVSAFSPLNMILVAIFGSFALSEILYLGRIVGAMVIVVGLYLVLWGKSTDSTRSMSEEMDDTSKTGQKEMMNKTTSTAANNLDHDSHFNLVP